MKVKLFTIVAIILAVTYFSYNLKNDASNYVSEFQNWKKDFNKIYESEAQEIYRLTLFAQNLKKIQIHNQKNDRTYQMGVNQFTDLTEEQFTARHLTLMPSNPKLRVQQINVHQDKTSVDEREINWVQKGFVTSIKNQGQCGACWAFAAIGPMEAQIKLKGGPLVSLSAQQLMDCSYSYGNQGCNGGYMTNGYKYIKDKGITTDQKYPYKGVYQQCIVDGGQYKVNGFVQIQDCKNLADSLMNLPIAVGIDASKFYTYKSGVFACPDKIMINHAFALVGMTKDYWLGKQQWGVNWGQNGFIKISKNGTACGICTLASYPN